MAKTDAQTGRVDKAAKLAPLIWSAPELAEMGKKQVEAIVDAQTEMFEALQEWHRDYFASTRSETILASDIATKLMAARSLPETGTAYQEWLGRWTAKLGEDSQRLLADSQKFMEASSRFVTNGWAVRA
jgi:hypothetical protein